MGLNLGTIIEFKSYIIKIEYWLVFIISLTTQKRKTTIGGKKLRTAEKMLTIAIEKFATVEDLSSGNRLFRKPSTP